MAKWICISIGLTITYFTYNQISPDQPVRFLALGDSYTIGQGVDNDEAWPSQLVSRLEKANYTIDTLIVIARTGWRTDNLQQAINDADLPGNFNLVSLLIGVNDQYQGISIDNYPDAFKKLLSTAIDLGNDNPESVMVLSIPDYGYTPFGRGSKGWISMEIDSYNQINKRISNEFGVDYFDITPISRKGLENPGLIAWDGLHPSGGMYALWVDFIMESLVEQPYTSLLTNKKDDMSDIKMYPTIINNYLYIQSDIEGIEVHVAQMNGKKVKQFNIKRALNRINFDDLEAGVYVIYMVKDRRILFRKKVIRF